MLSPSRNLNASRQLRTDPRGSFKPQPTNGYADSESTRRPWRPAFRNSTTGSANKSWLSYPTRPLLPTWPGTASTATSLDGVVIGPFSDGHSTEIPVSDVDITSRTSGSTLAAQNLSHTSTLPTPIEQPPTSFPGDNTKSSTNTDSWASYANRTPLPPPAPDAENGSPAFFNVTSANTSAGNSSVALLAFIPVIVGISLVSVALFLWCRARRRRWQKIFRAQLAQEAIETRRKTWGSDLTISSKGNETI